MKNPLKEWAEQNGLDMLGIAGVEPFSDLMPILKEKQSAGEYPPWVEQDLDLRLSPTSIFPAAKTIIAASSCYKAKEPQPLPPLAGKISRYAWGPDYHRLLPGRLEQLARHLKGRGLIDHWRIVVDTSPLLDRAIAVRAGIGFQGYNTAVFTPPYGSWVNLGALLVDKVLPVCDTQQQPFATSHCTGCRCCIKACPTKALNAPYRLQPKRCISYLTQTSGLLPVAVRPAVGLHLWGCDICQEVCPLNQGSKLGRYLPKDVSLMEHEQLLPLLTLGRNQFRRQFGQTAMAWRGKTTIQRNAAIVLGNGAWPEAVPDLNQGLHQPSPIVRASCAWALGRIGSTQARSYLSNALSTEKDSRVTKEIQQALE